MKKLSENQAKDIINKTPLLHDGSIISHRLSLLIPLIDSNGDINYASALDEAFEGTDNKKKQNLLNKLAVF